MALSRLLFAYMGLYGPPWTYLDLLEPLLPFLGLYGLCWASLDFSGRLWPISQATDTHTHKHIPKHSTSYQRLDYIPKRRQLKNKPRPLNELPTHCTSFSALVPVVFPWASLVFPGPLWAYLAFSSLLLAYMGLYGPIWASLAVSGQSPKLPTHTHKKHTDTFHKLPTTRVHPEKGTINKTNPDD